MRLSRRARLGMKNPVCHARAWGLGVTQQATLQVWGRLGGEDTRIAKHDKLKDGEEGTVHGLRVALGWLLGGRDISPSLSLYPPNSK